MADRSNAERAVLGCIMISPEAFADVKKILEPADFYKPEHRIIYEAALAVSKKDKVVDFATLTDELEAGEHFEYVGGYDYITDLCRGVMSASTAVQYANDIREAANVRRIHGLCVEVAESIQHGDAQDPVSLIATIDKRIADMRGQGRVDDSTWTAKDFVDKAHEYFYGKRTKGIMTGFPKLDLQTNGLRPGNLIILAARPSVGKTAFAVNIMINVLNKGGCVVFFSDEMGKDEVLSRITSIESSLALAKVTGEKTMNEVTKMEDALFRMEEEWGDKAVLVGDVPMDPTFIRSKLAALSRDRKIDLVIFDYIQLMTTKGGRRENRTTELADISREMKMIAKEFKVPNIVLSQLSRDNEKEKRVPILSDLRESGAIEQDADIVLFLHRPYKNQEVAPSEPDKKDNIAYLIMAKQRNGPTGTIKLSWDGPRTLFREMARNEAEPEPPPPPKPPYQPKQQKMRDLY